MHCRSARSVEVWLSWHFKNGYKTVPEAALVLLGDRLILFLSCASDWDFLSWEQIEVRTLVKRGVVLVSVFPSPVLDITRTELGMPTTFQASISFWLYRSICQYRWYRLCRVCEPLDYNSLRAGSLFPIVALPSSHSWRVLYGCAYKFNNQSKPQISSCIKSHAPIKSSDISCCRLVPRNHVCPL